MYAIRSYYVQSKDVYLRTATSVDAKGWATYGETTVRLPARRILCAPRPHRSARDAAEALRLDVITSYSIHYTKLYEALRSTTARRLVKTSILIVLGHARTSRPRGGRGADAERALTLVRRGSYNFV